MPITINAKKGRGDCERKTFIGIIHSMPSDRFCGDWEIEYFTVSTDLETEFDQTQGRWR